METSKKKECEKCALNTFLSNNNKYTDKYIDKAMKIATLLLTLVLILCFINEII